MSLFDLLFIALFLTTVCTLLTAGWFAIRRRFDRAGKILMRLAAGAGVYMGIVVAVSLVLPRQVIKIGETLCFDDWCVAVTGVKSTPESGRIAYRVDLRVSSRARRISQREKGLAVYLTDDQGRRYDPSESTGAFDVLLGPGDSADASRTFSLPAGARHVGVVIAHEAGGFPIAWFIIGYDSWFRKSPVVWVNGA